MWRQGNPHALLVGMQTDAATMENGMEVPQKIKMELPHKPTIPLLGIYLKTNNTNVKCQGDTYPQDRCHLGC